MEIEILKRIITSQREEFEKIFREAYIIQRENLDYVKPFLSHPNILAILGVRRSGKSVFSILLANELKENFGYINFDDERLIGLKTEDLDRVLQAFYELYGEIKLIILDEPQNVDGWELFANRLRRTKKVVISGSNSNLLSGELATRLTGRYIDFTLYPLSFREILNFKPDIYLTEDIAKVQNQLDCYFKESGFPEFRKFGSKIVENIYQDIINKDCLNRYNIKNKKTFKELSRYLTSNFSSEFTYSKLSNIFNIKDVHTVKNYVDYLKEAFIIFIIDRFSPKLKQQVISPKKVYTVDHGICNFLSFKLSKDLGKLIENVVCIELLRRKSTNSSLEIYYWKDYQQNEVDFVVKPGPKVKALIQVCWDISEYKTKEREIKSLIKASKELKCKNLIIINRDKEVEEKFNGEKIKFIPLWKWLMEIEK
ncbi:ATP-binding protein [Candidatus Woesearchaeota archaeon]|nr:ATP-binding protein [Candidatus Woesearchaeota archaeon]